MFKLLQPALPSLQHRPVTSASFYPLLQQGVRFHRPIEPFPTILIPVPKTPFKMAISDPFAGPLDSGALLNRFLSVGTYLLKAQF